MDARDLFPSGFHGAYNMNPNHRVSEAQLPHRTRLAVPHPVKYYYTGFGVSARVDQAPDLDTVARPSGAAEDAFAADVYALGKLLAHFFRDVCLSPLSCPLPYTYSPSLTHHRATRTSPSSIPSSRPCSPLPHSAPPPPPASRNFTR